MNWIEYAIARTGAQIRAQPKPPITEKQWVLWRICLGCIERYKREGK